MLRMPGMVDKTRPITQLGAPIEFKFTCSTQGIAAPTKWRQKSPQSSHAKRKNSPALV
jgi:hypothetical protein